MTRKLVFTRMYICVANNKSVYNLRFGTRKYINIGHYENGGVKGGREYRK